MVRRFVPPESLRFAPEEVPAFVKAKVHHEKAETMGKPYLVFLERYRAFELLYRDVAPLAAKHDRAVFARESGELDAMTFCLAQLSRPRIDNILSQPEIPELSVALAKRDPLRVIEGNELLSELGVGRAEWIRARDDLRYNLKANTQKALRALCTLLLVVRCACDPKVQRRVSLTRDDEVLESANAVLKTCVTHLVEHFVKDAQRFFSPPFRSNLRRV